MSDLILRPSGLAAEKGKPWALQLRYHDCCGPTHYSTICFVSDETAREIMRAGAPFWLYGDPDDPKNRSSAPTPFPDTTGAKHGR